MTAHDVTLRNPLWIDSDRTWSDVLEKANANILNDLGYAIAHNKGADVVAATDRVQAWAKAQGHDGIVARVTWDNDDTKKFRRMVGHSQVVVFDQAPSPAAATGSFVVEVKPVGENWGARNNLRFATRDEAEQAWERPARPLERRRGHARRRVG